MSGSSRPDYDTRLSLAIVALDLVMNVEPVVLW